MPGAFRPPVRPNVAARRPVLPQIPTKPIKIVPIIKQEEVNQPIAAVKQQAAQNVEESEYEYGSEEEEETK
jgi:hypothetical protein